MPNLIWLNSGGRRETSQSWRCSQNKQSILPGVSEPTSWEGFCIGCLGFCLQRRRKAQGESGRMELRLDLGRTASAVASFDLWKTQDRLSWASDWAFPHIYWRKIQSLWLLLTFVQAGVMDKKRILVKLLSLSTTDILGQIILYGGGGGILRFVGFLTASLASNH